MIKFGKYAIPTLLIVVIVGALVSVVNQPNVVDAQNSGNTATVERRDITVIVDGSGTISPERALNLSFAVGGTVELVNVRLGDVVASGDILASLDTTDLALQVELAQQSVTAQQASFNQLTDEPTALELAQANAGVAQAQSALASATIGLDNSLTQVMVTCANLDKAQDGLEQAQDAYDDYVRAGFDADATFLPDPDSLAGRALRDAQNNYDVVVAQCDVATLQSENSTGLDAARASLAQAEAARDNLINGINADQLNAATAQLRSAEIQLQQAQNRLDDAQITAPFDGIITAVNVVESQSVGTQVVAISIADVNNLHIDVNVDELDIAKVEVGQIAEITLDALEDTILTGSVAQISPAGIVLQGIVTYTVEVGLDTTDAPVRLGMSADVNIQVAILDDVLVVPRRAIQRNNELGEFIEIISGETTTNVAVVPGYSIDGMIVVEGEISEGQLVVIPSDEN